MPQWNQGKIILILQHGSSLPVSKHTHIFRNNSTGDSRNAQKQTTCSKLGPLASLGFLQKMLKLAKTFHTPPSIGCTYKICNCGIILLINKSPSKCFIFWPNNIISRIFYIRVFGKEATFSFCIIKQWYSAYNNIL